jgi:hypothetical protein
MVTLAAPHWLFLLPALLVVGWYWRGLRLAHPLRAAALIVLVLVLADPRMERRERGMDLWAIVDRSESAAALAESGVPEWRRLLERSRPDRADRLRWVNFAGEAVEQTGGETTTAGNPNLTRTRLALETVLAGLDPDRHARLLLFTDGYATEPLGDLGWKLQEAGVALDYRLLAPPDQADFQIVAMRLPARKRPGEPFVVDVEIRGTQDGEVPVRVSRDGGEGKTETVEVRQGTGRLRFAARLMEPGSHRYEARITADDARPGNNTFEGWIEVVAGPRALLVTKFPDDPVARVLAAQGLTVETVTEPGTLHAGQLSGTEALILNNVPAHELPVPFLEAVDFFVRRQGGGLLMAGGRHSFAAGGYYESALDPLLPVSMELKAEHRKLAVAMAIVMDRSGSMSATVPGGKTKMDLANEGAARAVELLGDADFITVHAVDSSPHREVPLTVVGPNRGKILGRVRRIGSMGGGIFVYEGLKAGWEDLQKAEVGQRHLILFSDAADSEEPGDYVRLLEEMTAGATTVSVIGLGTPKDTDAALLEDIAKRGGGRIFFTTDATTVPNLFAQETVAVARSLFVRDPVGVAATGRWLEISGDSLEWLPQVDGFNLSYARPEATVSALTTDEYQAPLVATVQRGLGRAAAVTFPLGGEFSDASRNWPAYGDFLQTLTRWLMGEALPPGLGILTDLDGTDLTVDLFHDDTWFQRLAVPPRIFLATGSRSGEEAVQEVTWERMEPGHYRARAQLEPRVPVRGAVQAGDLAIPFGPIVVGGSPEWTLDASRIEELRAVSRQSGGEDRVNLSEAWRQPVRRKMASIQPWLLVLALGLVLGDALATRLGWTWKLPRPADRRGREERRRGPAAAPDAYRARNENAGEPGESRSGAAAPSESPDPAATDEDPDGARRRSRFDRAKRLR